MTRLARLAAITATACVTLILGPAIASPPVSGHHSPAHRVSTRTIERGIAKQADANLDDPHGAHYAPGVDVERVDCWYTSADRVSCEATLTDGRQIDGSVFVPPSGDWYLYAEDDHADTRA